MIPPCCGLADRVTDDQALKALHDMARAYRARADRIAAASVIAAKRGGSKRAWS
jgi:hypothetical protein